MTSPSDTPTVYVWGVNSSRTRQHLFHVFVNPAWRPASKPRSQCGTTRSPDMDPVRDESLPRCNLCARIEAARVGAGWSVNATTGDPS